jgi:UDP-3-O-[3-hydroxymyristoyl] glucosamine N-acyltransferase
LTRSLQSHCMTLQQLANALDAELHGDPSRQVTGVAGIESAGPGDVTFVANAKYAPLARTTQAAAVLVRSDFAEIPAPTLRIADPYLAFAKAIALFYQTPEYKPSIHPTAQIAATARIGADAYIGPYAVVMDNAVIGDRAVIHAQVVIYPGVSIGDDFTAHAHAIVREHCRIGDRVLLQNGVVIGGDGFGFAKTAEGRWHKIPQSGPVVIEDDVEVQSLTAIDRASVGETRIGRGAKIDNLVQVGHGSRVGADTLLCAQVGLAGSSIIGDGVILAGQVGIAGHCTIGDGAILTAQSATSHDVPPGAMLSGSPAFDHRQWLRAVTIFARLPDLARLIRRKSAEVEK